MTVDFGFSIVKELLDVGRERFINIKGRHSILDTFMDVGHALEVTICVANQLENDSYC